MAHPAADRWQTINDVKASLLELTVMSAYDNQQWPIAMLNHYCSITMEQ
jgi:hypothetical protein